VIGHGVPLAEPVNRTLDGAQGLAPPDRRLGTAFDPLAQASHTLRQAVDGGFGTFGVGVTILDLLKQGHEFAAPRPPLAPRRIAGSVQRIRIEIGAGHRWSLCNETQPSRLHEGMTVTVGKTW